MDNGHQQTEQALRSSITNKTRIYSRQSKSRSSEQCNWRYCDIVETVVYSPEHKNWTYTVIDDTTTQRQKTKKTYKQTQILMLNQKLQTTYDNIVASYEAKGYELQEKDALSTKFDADSTTDQNVEIHLVHRTEAVKEEKK